MASAVKPLPLLLAVVLGVGLCLAVGRACEAPPGGPSRDSLALVARADSIAAGRDSITHLLAALDTAGTGRALAYRDSLRRARQGAALPPRPGPGPADSVLPLWIARADSLESRLANAEEEADSSRALTDRTLTNFHIAERAAQQALALLVLADSALREAAVTIGEKDAAIRKALGTDRVRLGVGADLHLVPGVLTAVAGVQVTTRRRLWLAGELEASAVGGFGVAATSADSVRTGLGMAARVSMTF